MGLKEVWDHKGDAGFKKPWKKTGTRVDDKDVYMLCTGYGFQTDSDIVPFCQERIVYDAVHDKHVPLKEFANHVDATDQEKFDETMWEKTEQDDDLGIPTSKCAGEFTEYLKYDKLQLLLEHAQDPDKLPGFNLDRRITDGRNQGITKREAMIQDLKRLLAHGKKYGAEHSGLVKISTTYEFKYQELGREYAVAHGDVPTLQSVGGGIRKTACEGLYWDLDFQDCYNTILYAVAQHYKFPADIIELLRTMTEDKDRTREDVARYYTCPPKAAKNLLIKHWMGGKVHQWLKDHNITWDAREEHHPIVRQLEDAAPRVCTLVLDTIPVLRPFLKEVNEQRKRDRQPLKTDYTALSYGLQTIERKLLTRMLHQLEDHRYRVDSKQFDGLYVWRDGKNGPFPNVIKEDIMGALARLDLGGGLHVPMRVEEKPVKSPYNLSSV